jgi:hypothetical protein
MQLMTLENEAFEGAKAASQISGEGERLTMDHLRSFTRRNIAHVLCYVDVIQRRVNPTQHIFIVRRSWLPFTKNSGYISIRCGPGKYRGHISIKTMASQL